MFLPSSHAGTRLQEFSCSTGVSLDAIPGLRAVTRPGRGQQRSVATADLRVASCTPARLNNTTVLAGVAQLESVPALNAVPKLSTTSNECT